MDFVHSLFADPGTRIVYLFAFGCVIPSLVRTHASHRVLRLTCDSPVESRCWASLGTHVTGVSFEISRVLTASLLNKVYSPLSFVLLERKLPDAAVQLLKNNLLVGRVSQCGKHAAGAVQMP